MAMQISALQDVGCDRIFTDTASGRLMQRTGLSEALAFVRPGDTLVVWKLDRLGRSMKGLVELSEQLDKDGIELRSITDGIDTKGPAGRFFFHILAAMAQMERELIQERTRAGLLAAKENGKRGGRRPKMTPNKIEAAKRLLASGMHFREVSHNLGVSLPTLYRHFPSRERAVLIPQNNDQQ